MKTCTSEPIDAAPPRLQSSSYKAQLPLPPSASALSPLDLSPSQSP
jgi:hypothetical protein